LASAVDFVGGGNQDNNGHGTWCLGAVGANGRMVGVAPEAELYSVKVLPASGRGDWKYFIQGLEWCLLHKMDVVSMSLGGGMSKEMQAEVSALLDELYQRGTKLIAAAGNFGHLFPDKDTVLFPAHFEQVVAVVSVNIEERRSPFSSQGEQAEIACAGEDVWGLWHGGGYARLSGTSMACPVFAGAVALMDGKSLRRRGRKLTPDEMRIVASQRADDRYLPGRDRKYGYGVFSFDRLDRQEQETVIEMTVDSPSAKVNGIECLIDPDNPLVVPRILQDRTMVPIRFVAETLGASVEWIQAKRKIIIRKGGY
jgi:subtilisin